MTENKTKRNPEEVNKTESPQPMQLPQPIKPSQPPQPPQPPRLVQLSHPNPKPILTTPIITTILDIKRLSPRMKDCVTIMGISSIAYILSNIYRPEPNVWVLAHAQ